MKTFNGHLLAVRKADAAKGINMAREVVIPKGQVIYRFYDLVRSPSPQARAEGAWWLEYEHFQSIKHFAERNGYTLGYAARLFAAVLYEWSEVNAYVACLAVEPLSAWKGRGKQMLSRQTDQRDLATMTPMQSNLEIYQLYVPGIGGTGSLSSSALKVRSHGVA